MSALLIALAIGLGVDAQGHGGAKAKAHAPAPPMRIAVPMVKNRPLLSNPQLTLDGKRVFVARTDLPSAPSGPGLEVVAIPLVPEAKAETFDFPAPVNANQVKILLSNSGKYLAVLSQGELWLKTVGEGIGPRRLYPPIEGEAPLGPRLSQASFASDSTWLLVESPTGWGRLAVKSNQFEALPLPAIDLTHGSMAMSGDGLHSVLVRSQAGEGYLNGGHVLALNITTAFAQGLDVENLYTEALVLPDGHPLGKSAGGALWLLRPKGRLPYFTPPLAAKHSSVDGYAINFAATKLAWTVTSDLDAPNPHAELWVAGAPPTPELPKGVGAGEE
jgi:hypothetical protein